MIMCRMTPLCGNLQRAGLLEHPRAGNPTDLRRSRNTWRVQSVVATPLLMRGVVHVVEEATDR